MTTVDILQLHCYTTAIHAVVAQPSRFNDQMYCAVCHDKPIFDKCTELLDTKYLKKHFITYCLLWNRTQKQMNLAVKKI